MGLQPPLEPLSPHALPLHVCEGSSHPSRPFHPRPKPKKFQALLSSNLNQTIHECGNVGFGTFDAVVSKTLCQLCTSLRFNHCALGRFAFNLWPKKMYSQGTQVPKITGDLYELS